MVGFYRDQLGIKTAAASPFFVEFETGMTSLAVLAINPSQNPGFEMCFEVEDVDLASADLRHRGMEFMDEVQSQPFGRLVHMRDPEGVIVTLLQPEQPSAARGEPYLATAIVNTWDFGAGVRFYRDRLGLPVLAEAPHWMEFGTEGARIAVHARAERPDAPAHAGQKLACRFEVADLEGWAEELETRGTSLATPPTEAEFGFYAEVMDPDGNLVVFREPAAVIPLPAAAAEAFEDDDVPQHSAMRHPLKKRSKAVSRVAMKPEYKETARDRQERAQSRPVAVTAASNGKPAKKVPVTSNRGAGPERTRLEPKTRSDPKRAKAKPAIGRLQKAERRSATSKKQAVATASRSRPVKRAAAKNGRKK
jgi:predicted enzyme related to lactoylglutathione lyase